MWFVFVQIYAIKFTLGKNISRKYIVMQYDGVQLW